MKATSNANHAETLIDLLRVQAQRLPDQTVLTFLENGEVEGESLTFAQLDRTARAIGAWLQAQGAAGQRVVLLHRPGLGYITALFGCLYAGAIAVPAFPPRNPQMMHTLGAIVTDAGARFALTDEFVLRRLQEVQSPLMQMLQWTSNERIGLDMAGSWQPPAVDAGSLAFLQYTSGSTGLPKGVMVSHGNLMHNTRAMCQVMGMTEADRMVSWLPLHHDLGLITGAFAPLYAGFRSVIMSPEAFLEKPVRWVQAMSRYRATTSGAPNFGYDLAVLKVTPEERAALDLSAWRVAFNGAEAVRPETLERFAQAYGPVGFARQAFCAGYGLAEATLIVSAGRPDLSTRVKSLKREALEQNRLEAGEGAAAQVVVSCGPIAPDMQVITVDPQRLTACEPGHVGEIWVAGPSVAQGYWQRTEATEATFGARLAGTGAGPYLRTGDLGFVDEHGELYITGRLKELIIIRGRNHYPADMESTAMKAHPGLMPGGTAAFALTVDGEERLALACEVRPDFAGDHAELFAAVRRAVSEVHELQVHALLLVEAGALPRTMSGKIQRFACRSRYQEGGLTLLAESRLDQTVAAQGSGGAGSAEAPVAVIDRAALLAAPEAGRAALAVEAVRALVAGVLKMDASMVAVDQPLNALGLDSLAAVELTHQVGARFGVTLPMTLLLEGPSVADVGARVAACVGAEADAAGAASREVGEFPASHGQAAMYFFYRMAPENAAYNIARAARMPEGIDPAAMRRALQRLTDRHPALRTTFHEGPEGPVQRVHARMEAFLGVEDATTWTEAELKARLEAESQRPFELERGPLVRWHLFRRGAVEYVLHLNFHHIISDLWTITLFIGELGALYIEEAGGAPAQLPPMKALFTDHVLEQRALLAGPEGERMKAYWQEKLGGELPVLNLPTDRPRPAVQTYRGATRNLRLDGALSKAILVLGRKNGATPFATLLAVWQVLLHRYTGQEDMVIGSPTAGRAKREHAHVMGYFVNPVAIRGDLSGNPSFLDLLSRVKESVHGALQNAAYPFPLLVDDLKVPRDASRNPIFQTMFVLQRAHKQADITAWAMADAGAPGFIGDRPCYALPIQQQAAGCDLTLFVAEVEGELRATLEYSTDLFDDTTADRLLSHFVRLLEAIVADPAQPVGLLPMLSQFETQQLLYAWNDTASAYPKELCLHQLFERQAALTPDAVAVALEGEKLTYAELNRKANQLARKLRTMGVGPDVLAGVFMERHPLLLVGMLAIHKAGGAYLPVDPTYPKDRVSYMLADAQAPVLLTQSHLAGLLGEHDATVICLDTEPLEGEDANPESLAGPEHMAYVIYTSGSTGRPKGAMIHHQGLVNYLWWALHAYEVAAGGGAPVHSSISFDLTVTSLWLPLLAGRRVELLSEARGIEALGGALMEPGGFSLVKITPAHMELIARQLPADRAAQSTRALVIGGEALQPEALAFWREHAPGTALINEYGPTETVVGCCVYWVPPDKPVAGSVPIGRPIANTQLYILDKYRQPVPVGVHGELYIGGDGVCRGYLNRPDLTAERFVQTPMGRLYKTGDLARYLPDGTLDFLGRIDEQVKIRGYRIELGEIETALAGHPAVDRVAVVVRSDGPGGSKRLVAYLVTRSEVTVAQLKEHLKVGLPEYMVPSAFVFLADLPLSPNGKVDRKALPAPERTVTEAAYAAPATPAEAALAAIWAELLGVDRVSVHDNFFELGGDSILSIQVVSRAARAGWKLTPQQLFQYPTVARLAALAQPVAPDAAPADQAPMTGPVLLTPIQHWFLEHDPAEPHHYNQAVVLQLKKPVNPALVARALTSLVEHHDALRLRIRRLDTGWEQSCEPQVEPVDVPVYPLAALPATAEQLQAGLNLSHGPLLRAAMFQGESQRLLIAIHHMAVDGVSWRILLEDLQLAIEQLTAGREPVLPPRTTSFQTWAEALAAHEPAERDYWLAPDRAAAAPLPVDCETGADTYASARTVTVTLSPGETHSLLSEVPAAYRTRIDDVLLTALGQALTAWTGRDAVLVNLEGHGREEIAPGLDLSRTVGWFTALYPVMLRMPAGAGGPADALVAVKEQLRAVPGKGLGYGVLRYLKGDAAVAAMPEAQVSFNYLGQMDQVTSSLLGPAPESAGPTRSPRLARRHLLEVDAMVVGDQLAVTWTYSANRHAADIVEGLAQAFAAHLRVLIAHCLTPGAGGCTPSDFPLARLTQAEELAAVLREAGARPTEVEDVYPLTALQRTMLSRTVQATEPGMYMVQLALELGGRIDPGAMERAWQTVVQRHAILRTSFAYRAAAHPLQVVHRSVAVRMTRLTIDSEAGLERYLQADRVQGFDLNRAPLLRLALAQTGPDRCCLVFSIHHLLLDGWSNGVILAEVVAAYEAITRGNAPKLAPAQPFGEYMEWLSRQNPSEAEAYWQRQLNGVTDLTRLPLADQTSEAGAPGTVPEVEAVLAGEELERIQMLARRHQLTLNTVVQGAWAALLGRYSETEEVVFGASVAGRPADLPGVESMVGPFTNTLPVRVRLAPDQPVLDLLRQMQLEAAGTRSYEHCPPADRPLFDTLVAFENYPLTGVKGALQVLQARNLEQNHYGLTLFAIPGEGTLALKLVYSRSRYAYRTAARLMGQLQRLLACLPEAPPAWPVREWLAVAEEADVAAD